jgi:hypothetical protein
MKITVDDIKIKIESYKENVKSFESDGMRGSRRDFEALARCELLLGDIKKARDYFDESNKSWLWFLDHNRDSLKKEHDTHEYLSCYKHRMLIQFFANGYDKARDFVNSNLEKIKKFNEEKIKIIESGWGQSLSDQIAYEKEILLFTFLMIKDFETAQTVIKEIYDRYDKSRCKTYKKGSKYPTALHAKLVANIVDGIIKKDKQLFLNALKELSTMREDLIASDHTLIDYADIDMLFFLEMARQTWPDLVVDSPFIPEKLRSRSYFEELQG